MRHGRRKGVLVPALSALAVGAAGVGIAFATLTGGPEQPDAARFSNPNSTSAAGRGTSPSPGGASATGGTGGTGAGAAAGDAGVAGRAGGNDASAAPATSGPANVDATAGTATGARTVTCPTVADKLPEVPASARDDVDRDLQVLETQIAEANRLIITAAGQGGPDFVRNTVLGPLEDKRVAAIDRIAAAIGRGGTRPIGLEVLAPCTVSQ